MICSDAQRDVNCNHLTTYEVTVGLRFESVKNRLKPCVAGRARGVDFLVEQCRPGKRDPIIAGSSWIAASISRLRRFEMGG